MPTWSRRRRFPARIICILDDRGLSTRKAEARTGVDHSELARIRRVKLDRFTIDRLMTIINRLDHDVEVEVTLHPRHAALQEAPGSG